MPSMTTYNDKHTFGQFLKFWRGLHSFSQEELAEKLDSSPRHISRLENGASRPSEPFIEALSAKLKMGHRDRNHLRLAAGYGPTQIKQDFNSPDLNWLRKAMRLTLQTLDPFPTTLSDSTGNILMVNKSWVAFYQKSLPNIDLNAVSNIFDFMFSRNGCGQIISNWDACRAMLLMALKQEIMLNNEPQQQQIFDHLLQKKDVPENWQQIAAKLEPMASFRLQINYENKLQQFYSVNQMVGALGPAAYVSEPKLTISTLYPEDETLGMSALLSDNMEHPLLPF